MKNYFYRLTYLCLFIIAISFTSCESSLEEEETETELEICSDASVGSYFSECVWIIADDNNSAVSNISIRFASFNIKAFNEANEIVEDGSWSIQEGIISINDVTAPLAPYAGEWTVYNCSVTSMTLKRNNEEIVLNSYCQ